MKLLTSKTSLAIVLVILAAAGMAFYFYTSLSDGGVALDLNVPKDEVNIGEPFDIDAVFTNNTGGTLSDVHINFELPANVISADSGKSGLETRELGEISHGQSHKETFRVIAVPGENPDYKVKASLVYSPSGLVAQFKKTKGQDVKVKNPDYNLELNSPEQVFSDEGFEIKATYSHGGEVPSPAEIELHIDYPKEMTVSTSSPEGGELTEDGISFKGLQGDDKQGDFSVKGSIELPDASKFDVSAKLVMHLFDQDYIITSQTQSIGVEPSPLTFQVVLANEGGAVLPGEKLTYVLIYRNNTNADLQDVVVRAKLTGEMFDISSLDTEAKLDGFTNTLTWDSQVFDELRSLRSGSGGQLTFTINTLAKPPIYRLNDKDYSLTVDADIESPTVPSSINADKTFNSAELTTKVAGLIEVGASAYFRDAASGIINTGPFPPHVGVPTQYTVHWRLANYNSDVDQVEVRARLANGVKFSGNAESNTGDAPSVDSDTGEVVWKVGNLIATTGVLNDKPEAIFQIEATPSASDAGNYMELLDVTQIYAHDQFADVTITGTDQQLTTRLEDDSTVNSSDGKVIQ